MSTRPTKRVHGTASATIGFLQGCTVRCRLIHFAAAAALLAAAALSFSGGGSRRTGGCRRDRGSPRGSFGAIVGLQFVVKRDVKRRRKRLRVRKSAMEREKEYQKRWLLSLTGAAELSPLLPLPLMEPFFRRRSGSGSAGPGSAVTQSMPLLPLLDFKARCSPCDSPDRVVRAIFCSPMTAWWSATTRNTARTARVLVKVRILLL